MNNDLKKLIGSLGVAVAGAVLVVLNAYVVKLPPDVQGIAVAVLLGAGHYVNAWGVKEGIVKNVLEGKESPRSTR
jgi:hypothetical protein